MDKKRILIVDDEQELSCIIAEMLQGCGYDTDTSADAASAYELLGKKPYHLILLDINLPDSTGFEICRELRENSRVPVIFASARTAEDDRISSFDIGGDDYLQKPYSMKELLSRINALMRRAYGAEEESRELGFGQVRIDTHSRTVTKGGKPVPLAQREYDLLSYLCKNKNTAVPKDKLISEVWGAFSEVEPSTLTVHIRWLREKLEDDPAVPVYIKTVWRLGYMLEDVK
ncbi:response regulator transcription factor [Ruminococcus sp.]|uniref:response regulator transcription factor n=1 Tax=Ruminococcus sp. TaxID=41978 RepID=UPI0025E49AD4|nr:response regulator transcription factor [Ruminococcus sp.]MBQ8967464.1 response regulator transcription factor [Ruminococcus sp.]